jgi:hypothetical protein
MYFLLNSDLPTILASEETAIMSNKPGHSFGEDLCSHFLRSLFALVPLSQETEPHSSTFPPIPNPIRFQYAPDQEFPPRLLSLKHFDTSAPAVLVPLPLGTGASEQTEITQSDSHNWEFRGRI